MTKRVCTYRTHCGNPCLIFPNLKRKRTTLEGSDWEQKSSRKQGRLSISSSVTRCLSIILCVVLVAYVEKPFIVKQAMVDVGPQMGKQICALSRMQCPGEMFHPNVFYLFIQTVYKQQYHGFGCLSGLLYNRTVIMLFLYSCTVWSHKT